MKVGQIEFSNLPFGVAQIDNTPGWESGKAAMFKSARNPHPSSRLNKSMAKAVATMDQILGAGWVSVRHHGLLEERFRVEVKHSTGVMVLEFDNTNNRLYHDCSQAHPGVCYHAFYVWAAYIAASEPTGEFSGELAKLNLANALQQADARSFFTAVDALYFDGKEKAPTVEVHVLDQADREMISDDTRVVLRYRQEDGVFTVPMKSTAPQGEADVTAGVQTAGMRNGDELFFDRDYTTDEVRRMELNKEKVRGKILPSFIGIGKTKVKTDTLIKQLNKGRVINTLFYGDTGGGKTTLVEIITDQLNLPIYQQTFSYNMEELDLFGGFVPGDDGKFKWVDGEFTKAFRNGGAYLADEFNYAKAGVVGSLNNALDHVGKLVLRNGEVIRRHPNFRFFACVNLSYAGTQRMNDAMINRFNRSYQIEDFERKEAVNIVMAETGYRNAAVIDKLLDIKDAIQSKFRNEQVEGGNISIRNIIDWIYDGQESGDLIESALSTVVWKCCVNDNDVQKEIYEDIIVTKLRGVKL